MNLTQEARNIATARGGACLEPVHLVSRQRVLWQCTFGHRWKATLGSIKGGHWCRECWTSTQAGKHLTLRDGLEQAQKIAKSHGGKCISNTYTRSSEKMTWQCRLGHLWSAVFSEVKGGSWCPECRTWQVRERVCRTLFEQILGKSFLKVRNLPWLKGESGKLLELDGYNSELGIGFEYQGEYHFYQNSFFHRDKKLELVQAQDSLKQKLCRENGVTLIEVPFTVKDSMEHFILNKLKELGLESKIVKTQDFDLSGLEIKEAQNKIQQLHDIASKNGGICLSDVWIDTASKYRFQCCVGHKWTALSCNIIKGSWCPGCKGKRIAESKLDPDGLHKMRQLAEERGGRFLSERYLGVNVKHTWGCSKGHVWNICPTDVQKGHWCRECFLLPNQGHLNILRQIAIGKGGKCLASTYLGSAKPLEFECAKGHRWMARPGNIKHNGSWCPQCKGSKE